MNIGWIIGEVLILPEARSWIEVGYFGVGLLMTASGRAERRLPPPHKRLGAGGQRRGRRAVQNVAKLAAVWKEMPS